MMLKLMGREGPLAKASASCEEGEQVLKQLVRPRLD